MTKGYLFDPEASDRPPFAPGSETSRAAAERIAPVVANMKREVLMTYASFGRGGATRQEVADAGPYVEATVCARTTFLVGIGALERTGERRPTHNKFGVVGKFEAYVLRITQAGAAMLLIPEGQE